MIPLIVTHPGILRLSGASAEAEMRAPMSDCLVYVDLAGGPCDGGTLPVRLRSVSGPEPTANDLGGRSM
ncbi:hypothetical protein GCM10022214_69410 [Actinomadura miaoliensis]|uniref:Uncharacterized protein n=1 Tax=Actinomadura miaoliensis TaxID=430685 RepID=A0ABP7WT07_9ACTN